jgi:hypothetical protein
MVIIIQNKIRYFELYSNVYFYSEKPNHLFLQNLHTPELSDLLGEESQDMYKELTSYIPILG